MNELGTAVAWSAIQVTVLAIVAGGLYLAVARRGPGVASFVTVASLGIILAITGLVFFPLPRWCQWDFGASCTAPPEATMVSRVIPPSPVAEPTSVGPDPAVASGSDQEASGLTWSMASFRRTWERLRRVQVPSPEGTVRWPEVVALVFLTGAGLGLLRFLLGLGAVQVCRRRSRPIDDAMFVLAKTLAADMGCPRPVELRECPNLATAATVGWRRPLVLLPSDWRTWTETEKRAVLAHELAHIQRGDYLAGLLARISVALHFYHPLVYWLAGRLHLQQELAADALGARWAGGRSSYLVALAKLALRQEERSPGWPARAFLPARGTLMRRIHMLRANKRSQGRPLPWTVRALTVGLLATVAVGVAALRGAAPASRGETPAGEGNTPTPSLGRLDESLHTGDTITFNERNFDVFVWSGQVQEREPFDLSWFPSDGLGAFAVRPAAVLKRPGMERLVEELNGQITREFKKLGMSGGLGLPLEDLDQVLGKYLVLHQMETEDGKKEALVMGLYMLRTVKDFDWKSLLQSNPPELAAIPYQGKVYYKPIEGALPGVVHNPVLPYLGKDMCYFIPDARTLIVDTEANLRRLIKRGPASRPEWVWAEGWAKVERGLAAATLDCRNGRLLSDEARAEGPKSPEEAIILNIEQAVWGLDGPEDFVMEGFARCATEEAAEAAFKQAKGLLGMTRLEFWLSSARKKPSSDLENQGIRFASDLLKHAKVERQEKQISFRTEAKINSTELLEALIKEMK
jgi:beta-lactamase regulating signal transducer with metallopeptidase domain